MKPFKFRLEKLLEFRRRQKEKAQADFATAVHSLNEAQHKLERQQIRLAQYLELLRKEQNNNLNIDQLKNLHVYLDKIKGELKELEEQRNKAVEVRDECLRIYNEAVRAYDIVDRYKQKQRDAYNFEVLKEEQQLLDEIGLQLYIRA